MKYDRNKNLSVKEYLNEIKLYLKDIITLSLLKIKMTSKQCIQKVIT